MNEPTPLDKNLYQQRFNQHLVYWEQSIKTHDYLQLPARKSMQLQWVIACLVGFMAATWVKNNLSQSELVFYSVLIAPLLLVLGLAVWGSLQLEKLQQPIINARNRLLISPYLYAGFLDIQLPEAQRLEKESKLFYAALHSLPRIHGVNYKIGNISLCFFPEKGLLLCKDSTVYSKSPLLWCCPPIPIPALMDKKQQFGYFPELERAGGFYTDDKLDAAALLKQKEHFLLEFIQKYPQELLIIFSEQQVFAFLPNWPTELAHYHKSELIPDKRLFAGLQAISRLLADFERL